MGKCSRALFKSCMASVVSGKQELGKTSLRNGITTQYIHVVSKHPPLSSSVIVSQVTLMLQIAFIAGWSVKPAHKKLSHSVGSPHTLPESQQHHQKLFHPSRDNTNSGISHHFILLAVQGKFLHDPSRPKRHTARALPPLDDEFSPAPGNRIFWPLAPVLEGASPEVLLRLSPRSRKEEG